jgi:hypothetical protein
VAAIMKVLVVSTPGAGHVTPLVPIIRALLAGGDGVLVASGPEAAPIIEKTGARFALAGRSQAEWMARLATRTRGNPGDGVAADGILHYFLPRAFAEIGVDEMVDDVLRHGQEFAPDVVVVPSRGSPSRPGTRWCSATRAVPKHSRTRPRKLGPRASEPVDDLNVAL